MNELSQRRGAASLAAAVPTPTSKRDEITASKRLHELSLRLLHTNDMEGALAEVLDAAIELLGGDFGVVQLYDEASQALRIAAQCGFQPDSLRLFELVDADDPSTCGRALRTGRRVIVEDVNEDDDFADLRLVAANAGYRSAQSTPLIGRHGQVLGMLSTHHREAHRPTPSDLDILDLYAQQAVLTLERLRATERVQQSEQRYRTLFEAVEQGFCVMEVLLDPAGEPIDYRFIECNSAFAQHTGLEAAEGRTALELVPNLEPWWIATYGRVALTGEPAHFTHASQVMNHRWFDFHAFRLGPAERRQVALFFKDVTEQRLAQQRDGFLIALDDATRVLTEPEDISTTIARLLCENLSADRVAYTEVDADEDGLSIIGDYSPELPSVNGCYRFSDYGQSLRETLRAGRTFVIEDIERSEMSSEERGRYAVREVTAMVQVPLHKNGRLRSTIAVYQSMPRAWRVEEIELVCAFTNRCWEAIERARVMRALRASEARLRELAEALPTIVWECAADGDVIWFNRRLQSYSGVAEQDVLGWDWESIFDAGDLTGVRAEWERVLRTGEEYIGEARLRRHDGAMRWFLLRTVPVSDEHGRVLRWYGTATD
ncbi:MAG: GAF domain-containing protein, partial [Gammaproteobacteria bacterium]